MRSLTGFVACALLVACSEQPVEVATASTQREANFLAMVLQEHEPTVEPVVAQRETVYRINVAKEQLTAARLELARRGLPREPVSGLGALSGSSLSIPTRSEERARLTHAMTEQLRGEIERLPGVVDVSILLVLPSDDSDLLGRSPKPTKLSVVVTVLDKAGSADVMKSVQSLISPLGLAADSGENVSVVGVDDEFRGNPNENSPDRLDDGGGERSGAPGTVAAQSWVEQYGREKIVLATAALALLALLLIWAGYLFVHKRAKARQVT